MILHSAYPKLVNTKACDRIFITAATNSACVGVSFSNFNSNHSLAFILQTATSYLFYILLVNVCARFRLYTKSAIKNLLELPAKDRCVHKISKIAPE